MRLRNIPGADAAVTACPYVIDEPSALRGKWNTHFEKEQPIHIEVGMGKGQFLFGQAAAHPDINYIGIERYTSVLLRAIQKIDPENPPKNLLFVCMDAAELPEVFAPDEISRIYLNFSDPWPKNRDRKRRLTHVNFLETYKKLLKPNGILRIKTDNVGLFDFTLDQLEQAGFETFDLTRDLHSSDIENEVMTEYEKRFSEQGFPINAVKAKVKRD